MKLYKNKENYLLALHKQFFYRHSIKGLGQIYSKDDYDCVVEYMEKNCVFKKSLNIEDKIKSFSYKPVTFEKQQNHPLTKIFT